MRSSLCVVAAVLFAWADYAEQRPVNGAVELASEEMLDVFGGGCNSICRNTCQSTSEGCGNCYEPAGQGELCLGGGGGEGTAWNCVSSGSIGVGCTEGDGDSATCTPDKVCTCSGGTPNNCEEELNPGTKNGKAGECNTYSCDI